MSSDSYSFKLFKRRPSFMDGISALVDFSDIKDRYNFHTTGREADAESLRNDWKAIGKDMQDAIDIYVR